MTHYTLITGASGFIGSAFARRLAAERPVVGISRRELEGDIVSMQGEFHSPEDLAKLDGFDISCVVHLAAETGGCDEESGLAVNVLGTRRLIRYALDRGCRKFVLASSIAATGCLSPDFVPLQLPIPDDHPCLANDAYGFSKAMMEDLTHYFYRAVPNSDFINLRLGAVCNSGLPGQYSAANPPGLPFVNMGNVMLSDVLNALEVAVNAPILPGVRTYNVVGPDSNCSDPVPDVLRAAFGTRIEGLDLSWYDQPGHAYDSLYAINKIATKLGFTPKEPLRLKSAEK